MTPDVSVLTPVHERHLGFLGDAYESLVQQSVEWEWLVQLDGPAAALPAQIASDPRVRVEANEARLGIAVTRNRALVRARAALAFALDADDVLLPGALGALRTAVETSDSAFAFGRSLLLLPDGRVQPFRPRHLEPGVVEPGRLEAVWREHGTPPIKTATVLWRKEYLLAAGAWAAVSAAEDTVLVLAVNFVHAGLYADCDVHLYRRHRGQTIESAAFVDWHARNWEYMHQRLNAMRAVAGIPVPPGYAEPPPRVDDVPPLERAELSSADASRRRRADELARRGDDVVGVDAGLGEELRGLS